MNLPLVEKYFGSLSPLIGRKKDADENVNVKTRQSVTLTLYGRWQRPTQSILLLSEKD